MEKNIKSIIESLLFVWGEPLPVERIAAVVEAPVRVVRQNIQDLQTEYIMRDSGIQLIQVENAFQFASRRDNAQYIEKLLNQSKSKGLSQSALEILAVVAYNQPVSKAQIEGIRGVKSDKAMSNLLERRLIEEAGRAEKPGRPMLYATTDEFLRVFGFSSLKDLPELESITKTFEEWSQNK